MIRGILRIIVAGFLLFMFVLPVQYFIRKAVLTHHLQRQENQAIGSVNIANARVKDIQQVLLDTKHYSGPVEGKMDLKTRLAIRRFQDERGLAITGIVDPKTLSELNKRGIPEQKIKQAKVLSKQEKEKKQIAKANKKVADKEVVQDKAKLQGKIVISKVNSKERVREIQVALKKLGFYKNNVDGKLGIQTKKAVKEFQLSKNLKADGVVGPRTWGELKVTIINNK